MTQDEPGAIARLSNNDEVVSANRHGAASRVEVGPQCNPLTHLAVPGQSSQLDMTTEFEKIIRLSTSFDRWSRRVRGRNHDQCHTERKIPWRRDLGNGSFTHTRARGRPENAGGLVSTSGVAVSRPVHLRCGADQLQPQLWRTRPVPTQRYGNSALTPASGARNRF